MSGENTATPIVQFGTSRFLLAHADLFVSEALARGEALGRITVVQTTDSAESAARIGALAAGAAYPVRIRGLVDGRAVDEERHCSAIGGALVAGRDWREVRKAFARARVILSNTGDRGFDLHAADTAESVTDRSRAPKGFPAKLAALLLERFELFPEAPVSILPCELVEKNGDRLRGIVRALAVDWSFPAAFLDYFDRKCLFANSLVDRIVSEPIAPVGAVAEPYALWAIERREGLVLPCRHEAIVVTDDLGRYERLKLYFLNLGHTFLADRWMADGRRRDETVREILDDAEIRQSLENVWRFEVLPLFAADGPGGDAERYMDQVLDRFMNPFLAHRLSDIAGNHDEKKRRRLQPVIDRAGQLGLDIAQPGIRAVLDRAS